jgi:cytoskeletal protein RodZ
MSALGESFRTARESQGLSLSEVADRIHIRSAYLAAIETEDWQAIGPAVYVRGFVRNYARFLGLDADAAVARVAAGSPGSSPIAGPASGRSEPSRSGLSTRGQPRRPGGVPGEAPKAGLSLWAVAGLAVALVLVAFVGYEYYVYSRQAVSHSGEAAFAGPAPTSTAVPATPPTRIVPRSTELPNASKNTNKSSAFSVRLKDSSWLRVVIDGKVELEGIYPGGTSRSFAGRSATIRVGNAGGVSVIVDGKDLGPMGGLGDVAERSFQL